MSRSAVILTVLMTVSAAWAQNESVDAAEKMTKNPVSKSNAPTCEKLLKAFNSYDELNKKGRLEAKFSIFEITDLSQDSSFEGILAVPEVPRNAVLTLTATSNGALDLKRNSVTGGFTLWKSDNHYRIALVDPHMFLRHRFSGHFTVNLKADKNVLCEQEFQITHGE
jgi:hypothetical protein